MKIPLVGQAYTSRSVAAAAQSSINLIEEAIEVIEGKNKAALYGAPGKHLATAALTAGVRGLWSGGGRLFVAHSTFLTELDQDYNIVSSHNYTAIDDGQPVQMFGNGNQLLVISGGLAYIDNGAGPVACDFSDSTGTVDTDGVNVKTSAGDVQFATDGSWPGKDITINAVVYTILSVADDGKSMVLTSTAGTQTAVDFSVEGDPVTAVTGAFLDGFFIVQRPPFNDSQVQGRSFNISANNDGSSWDQLDFGVKEGYADYIQSILADEEYLYVLGTETIERWVNVGGQDFPLQRVNGEVIHLGSTARYAPVAISGSIALIGGDSRGGITAYVLNGASPERISTHAIEQIWKKSGFTAAAIAYSYVEEGHYFWVINWGSRCFHYDFTTKAWGERASWDGTNFGPYHTYFHTYITEWGGGRHITAGDFLTGNIYESSINFYDDAGQDLCWQRAMPYQYNDGNWMFFGRLTLEMETGSTDSTTVAPIVNFDHSDNRGKTFSRPRPMKAGIKDDFSARMYLNRGGKSRGRVPRLTGAGQYKVALVDLQYECQLGTR